MRGIGLKLQNCFHKMLVYEGIDEAVKWKTIDSALETACLIRRETKTSLQ